MEIIEMSWSWGCFNWMWFQKDYLQDGSGDEVVKMNPDKVRLVLDVWSNVWWAQPSIQHHHRFGGLRIQILTFGYVTLPSLSLMQRIHFPSWYLVCRCYPIRRILMRKWWTSAATDQEQFLFQMKFHKIHKKNSLDADEFVFPITKLFEEGF